MRDKSLYPDLKVNGRLFPLWVLQNFKKYKLDPILKKRVKIHVIYFLRQEQKN